MKEINDIIKACEEANLQNKQTGLATVVYVEGSSYRICISFEAGVNTYSSSGMQ